MSDSEFEDDLSYLAWKKEIDELKLLKEKFKDADEKKKGNGVM